MIFVPTCRGEKWESNTFFNLNELCNKISINEQKQKKSWEIFFFGLVQVEFYRGVRAVITTQLL